MIEDCGVSWQELAQRFGARVAELVLSETQERCGDPRMTWEARKRAAIAQIARGDHASKIIALSDKLSNMRAIRRDFERDGERTFDRFHQHDKRRHAWYYRSCASLLKDELGETDAWRELNEHIGHVFSEDDAESCLQKAAYAG